MQPRAYTNSLSEESENKNPAYVRNPAKLCRDTVRLVTLSNDCHRDGLRTGLTGAVGKGQGDERFLSPFLVEKEEKTGQVCFGEA